MRRLELRQLGPGLLGFWALYFAIVALSSLTGVLASLHVLPAGWRWVSGNLAFMTASTGKLVVPIWILPLSYSISTVGPWRRRPASKDSRQGRTRGPNFILYGA